MAASIKCKFILKKCARFLFGEELKSFGEQNEETEILDESCKGLWKLYPGENNDLILSYLESDHLLLTKKNIILESFSLPCSKSCLKGVAKADNLLVSCALQDGNIRQFRMQFDAQDGIDSIAKRKQCTDMLKKYIKIIDYDETSETSKENKISNIDEFLLDKMLCRKGYSVSLSKENLKQILTLCLTDNTFPAYVAEVDKMLKNMANIGES
ncbi:uncharacterized protein TNIN_236961 [Trichonephila inaurata madagascariensis]|uniref:Uncharacterized protein n=1 Tax=Trichonephila inaurata madagascariensis TaxID=2747483 RepID=A0A8X6XT66_9ARAC|nr:uncharacterized protein TNIN_236961 [Trichonephila inaurata madagascariensis]